MAPLTMAVTIRPYVDPLEPRVQCHFCGQAIYFVQARWIGPWAICKECIDADRDEDPRPQ